jgi:hypothetical protein
MPKFNDWDESDDFDDFSDFRSMRDRSLDDIAGEPVGRRFAVPANGRTGPGGTSRIRRSFTTSLPRLSLVKPVRTFHVFLSVIFVAASLAGDVLAQQSSVRQGSSERAARASWRPTRSHVVKEAAKSPTESDSKAPSGKVRLVDHRERVVQYSETIPVPTPDPQSVLDPVYEPMPLDGQVVISPTFDGACDAMPVPCGCGDSFCVGDCGSCNTCTTGTCGSGNCTMCGELCSPNAWRPCITICLPQDGWVSFEYLAWWQDGMALPPLVTTSVDPNVAQAQAGVLGVPTTQILFGGRDVLEDSFNGGRLQFGVWLDRCHTWGVGAEYFELDQESTSFTGTSTGNPILARPFFNTQTGLEDSELVAFPNVVSGTVTASAESQLVGAGFHFRYLTCCNEGCSQLLFCSCPERFCSRNETIFGYRYLELEEGVTVTENLTSGLVNAPGSFAISDRFQTRNQFNGFDFGWKYRRTRGFWTYDAMFRMGVGVTRQRVAISGQTTLNDPNNNPTVRTLQGGLLAQTSNIGTYRQDEFAVVPEFRTNIGYQLTDHWRATFGYTFIYWSNVVRPGQQISRDLNPDLLPPPADPFTGSQRPAFAFDTTDYWVQGLNAGLEYRW